MVAVSVLASLTASALALAANGAARLAAPDEAALRAPALYICAASAVIGGILAVAARRSPSRRHALLVASAACFPVAAAGLALMYGSNGEITGGELGAYRNWSLYLSFFSACALAWKVAGREKNSLLFLKLGAGLFAATFLPPGLALMGMFRLSPGFQLLWGTCALSALAALLNRLRKHRSE